MERLTEKFVSNLPDEVLEKLGIADIPKEEYEIKGTNGELCRETCEKYKCDSCPVQKAIDKLAEYEDLEEQGLLLRLPCKAGDTVYKVYSPNRLIEPYTYKTIVIQSLTQIVEYIEKELWNKTVFLTQEEAEQALKQMGE